MKGRKFNVLWKINICKMIISYNNESKTSEAIPQIKFGFSRSDQDFSKELKFLKLINRLANKG
jgi:hypothetical protein